MEPTRDDYREHEEWAASMRGKYPDWDVNEGALPRFVPPEDRPKFEAYAASYPERQERARAAKLETVEEMLEREAREFERFGLQNRADAMRRSER